MNYAYSRRKTPNAEKWLERSLEIAPGAISWSIIIGMGILSAVSPFYAAVIMIAFVLYWVLRLLYMNIFLVLSYIRLAAEKDTDWAKRIEELDRPDIRSKDIYHLVIISVARETREIVEPGIAAVANGKYPARRIMTVIALEESAPDDVKRGIYEIQKKYSGFFFKLAVTEHPGNLPGEAKVKGANATYAAKYASGYFKEAAIPYENIIVSSFDADTVPNPNYFGCLTYHYIVTKDRTRASFQPIPVYHNNIWEVPAFARIIDIGTSFFQLVEATDPKKMITFSSHSMSFKALVEVGYWPVDMISDDSAIFWKAFIYYDGRYQTIPIYTTVSMDIASGRNLRETFVSIYRQKRRWAWGVENFPLVIRAFLKSNTIPLYKRFVYGFRLLESFVSWATWSFLLGFISWLPGIFASREFATSTIYYIAPRIQRSIFSLASIGLIVCMVISLQLLPRKKAGRRLLIRLMHGLEWLFIPVVIMVLSALPALDAQTRLMFGRYMEFRVTEKYRRK